MIDSNGEHFDVVDEIKLWPLVVGVVVLAVVVGAAITMIFWRRVA